jgi:hypothetical protein
MNLSFRKETVTKLSASKQSTRAIPTGDGDSIDDAKVKMTSSARSHRQKQQQQQQQQQQQHQQSSPIRKSIYKRPPRDRRNEIVLVVIVMGLCIACLLHGWYVHTTVIQDSAQREHDLQVVLDQVPKVGRRKKHGDTPKKSLGSSSNQGAERISSNDEEEQEVEEQFSISSTHSGPSHLPLESIFRRSIRSCLPNINLQCQTYVPHHLDDKKQSSSSSARVALLAPPGDLGDWIFRWVSQLVDSIPTSYLGDHVQMDLQRVTHVPPYGYAETHGWTKVLRVLPRSLLLGAADAIRGTLVLGQTQQSLSLRDLKMALRQILRYHCRISDLATHTAVLTFDMDTLVETPYVARQAVLRFLNVTAVERGEMLPIHRHDDLLVDEEGADESSQGIQVMNEQDVMATSTNVESYAMSLLTWIEQHEQIDVIHELNRVLRHELELSANFTKWPCESFWSTGDGPHGLDLSDFGRRLAESLAPDCESQFSKCIIQKDHCEHVGDPLCKGA